MFVKVKQLPKGEFLKRKKEHSKVYSRGDYDRSYKKYRINDCDDISRDLLVDGDKLVWIGFDY